jgi:integrase
MFNLAIDSKLRGYDVVSLTVEDVAPKGAATDRTTVRQKKTGHPVRFELSEQTREAVEAYIRAAHKKAGEFLFTSRRYAGRSLTTRQYARLVSGWTAGLAWIQQCMALTRSAVPRPHSSIARPATYVPSKIKSTVRYLGIEVDDALAIAEQVDV